MSYSPSPYLKDLPERRSTALAWAKAARAGGMTHALTLTPDLYISSPGVAAGRVNLLCKKLFREMNCSYYGMSRRQSARETKLRFLGTYELRNSGGGPYPHAHLAFMLPEEEWDMAMFLDNYWASTDHLGEWRPGARADKSRLGRRPQWHMQPITSGVGWAQYITKQMSPDSDEMKILVPDKFIDRRYRSPLHDEVLLGD